MRVDGIALVLITGGTIHLAHDPFGFDSLRSLFDSK